MTTSSRAQRKARPVTLTWLQRAALHYLERYASSSENLRRVLARKVERRLRERDEPLGEDEQAAARALVDAVVELALAGGYVDDARYAQAKVASLRRKGGSRRAIAARLHARGLDRETIGRALREHETQEAHSADGAGCEPDAERVAARAYARRRRLGPFRPVGRAERRDRDVAAMVRAGFGYEVAREAIDGERVEESGSITGLSPFRPGR
ncbi:MAG: regulatory protein RecX [Salinarimonadaceae bacterium]|nr:MAG: regulatory protein RecX [Salinarimonadaceae bacterium]